MSLDYTNIQSAVKKFYLPTVTNNIYDSNPVLFRMKGSRVLVKGGESIAANVRYAKPVASGWFAGADTLNTTDAETNTLAVWDWKNAYANIIITGEDEDRANTNEKIVDLLKEKTENAQMALEDQLGEGIFSDGTSNTKSLQGLRLAAANTGTYGNIAKQTYAWFQGQVDATTTTVTLAALNTKISDVANLGGKTSSIFTTVDVIDNIHGLLQPQQRYVDVKMADAGFQTIAIKGIPIIADSHCPASYLFGVDERYLKFYVNSNRNFDVGDFIQAVNQDVKVAKVIVRCALIDTAPRTLFMFSALAA